MNRALLVVRLSRMTDETTSPERQLAATKGEAERRNLKIVGVAEDLNVSASKVSPFRRPVLGPWLTEKFGEFDVIIWARLDRAVRSMGDLHELAKWAKERGKRLIFASGPGDQMESQSNSERVIGAQAYLRQVGRWGGGMVPYGLRPVPFDGDGKKGWKLVHEPTTAPIVKEMVERVIAGHAQLAIARDLQRRGVPTPRDFQDQQNGRDRGKARKWSVPAVGDFLRSRALLGETMHNGQLVRDADGAPILRAEPLVTETEWGQLQAALADRAVTRVRTQTPHLLLGVIKCGGCGGPLYRQQYAKKGRPYVYFRCSGYMVEHNGCNERFRAEAIERGFQAIFLARVGHLEVERREFVAGHDNTDDLLNLDRLLADLEDEYDRGLVADRDRYLERKIRLKERRDKLAAETVRTARYRNVGTGMTYSEYWAGASVDQRRKLLLDSEIIAYAGRSQAFDAAREASCGFGDADAAGFWAAVHLEPRDLGSTDLNLTMMWRGDLAQRLKRTAQ